MTTPGQYAAQKQLKVKTKAQKEGVKVKKPKVIKANVSSAVNKN